MRTLPFRAMNTSVLLAAEGGGWAQIGLQAARMYIHASERRFSRFLPNSELSHLNRSAGEWLTVSADMLELLKLSFTFYEQTGRLFDPSILPDLKRMGYDRTMDEVRTRGDVFPPASTRTLRPAFSEIGFDLSRSRVRLPSGMEIDLGGIAKGWIAGKAADLLSNFTDAGAVNAGGDMLFFGERTEAQDWAVYIENPHYPSRMLSVLNVSSGAVATSSVAKRAWTQNGRARHHLIDPRTGESAQTDWQSVTVTAPSLLVAEVYAKVLLIAGSSLADELIARRPEVEYLAVDSRENFHGSPNLLASASTLWSELGKLQLQNQGLLS
jgi:thiamine biosynthesis lipoprotein